jgi:LysM repeat protein
MNLCFNRHVCRAFVFAMVLLKPLQSVQAHTSSSVGLELANIKEDLGALKHAVSALQLSVEQLEADNHKLKTALQNSIKDYQSLRKHYTDLLAQQKKEYTELIEHKHKSLLEEIQKLMLADSAAAPSAYLAIDYPKEGVSYKIKKGDTLSKIALEHKSKVIYIQAANKIQDPNKDLHVGQTIFIPQGK